MSQILTIARLTFFEAARRRILLAALILSALFLVVYGIGFNYIHLELQTETGGRFLLMQEIHNFLTLAGLYAVNFLTIMMAGLTSVDTISGEINTGTIQSLVTKPIRRREVILGKWLGFMFMLTLYVLLMAGGVQGIVYSLGDYLVTGYWRGLGLLWLNGVLILSVSFVGGTMLSTLANGVLVFGLFGVAFVGGWIEQIGAMIENEAAVNIGIVSSLILPGEALWKRAAFEMSSPIVTAMGISPFTSGQSVPSPIMVWYAVAYILVMLLWAIRAFSKRDL
ncbi:MAG: ABC transporter permease [Anaerolineales bacterium]|nr:ABC transporter permease [Anaerolineales bacterium]